MFTGLGFEGQNSWFIWEVFGYYFFNIFILHGFLLLEINCVYYDTCDCFAQYGLRIIFCKVFFSVVFSLDVQCVSLSVLSDTLWPCVLKPARLLCLWNSPGKNTGVGSQSLLQRIFPTQGLNPGLPHQADSTIWVINMNLSKLTDPSFWNLRSVLKSIQYISLQIL